MVGDPVFSGIYTISQAARLINASPKKLRNWVVGKPNSVNGPIIHSEFDPLDHQIAISFVNLIEAKFIDAFAKDGINIRSIRSMADEAKRVIKHPHPFATNAIFRTDGKTIFMIGVDGANHEDEGLVYDLRKKNHAIFEAVKRELKKEVMYGPTGLAEAWFPRKDIAPTVMLHPKVAFGQPALRDIGVPTETLYTTYLAEDKNLSSVARWFDIPVQRVKEAIRFEEELARTLH